MNFKYLEYKKNKSENNKFLKNNTNFVNAYLFFSYISIINI